MMPKHKKLVSSKAGLPPGSVIYIGDEPPDATCIKTHIYDQSIYRCEEGFNLSVIKKAMADGLSIWIDVCGLADTVQISQIGQLLNIHPLVVEDIVNTKQRPKLDLFDEYLFVVFKLLDSTEDQFVFKHEQVSLLMKKNILLSFRESDEHNLKSFYNRLGSETSFIREHGVAYLLYSLMDNMVDQYFQFVEQSTKMIEEMEDLSISDPERIEPKQIYLLKRSTIHLHKAIAPLRDIIHSLLRDADQFISKKYFVYYRDLHDHTVRLIESVDFHQELISETLTV